MKKLLFLAIVTFLMIACTGNKTTSQRELQPSDTLYTAEAAKQLQESKAHEYAARYRLQEERLNTEREQAAKKRIGLIATLLGIMLLIVAFFVFLLVQQLRSIREKNAVLTKEITDRIANEENSARPSRSRLTSRHLTTANYMNTCIASS